jgi:DNA-binding XRE family transcriptional regulator
MSALETFFSTCYIVSMNKDEFRRWRKDLGWTQLEAGQQLGVSRATIVRYEQGEIPRMVELATERLTELLPSDST